MAAFWLKVLRYPLTLLVIGFFAFFLFYGLDGFVASHPKPIHHTLFEPLVALAGGALSVWLYRLFARYVEGQPNGDFAAPRAVGELAAGLGFGFVLFSVMTGVVAAMGGFAVDGLRGEGDLWGMLTLGIISGLFEETIFRGIVFRHLEQLVGSWWALAAVSAFFGVAHIFNPGATWFAAFAIALEAGVLLGAAYMLTRRLWLAIGIHAAWNFTQGWVYSIPVSGGKAAEGLLITHRMGPEWLTGGAFGLEASAVALMVATAAGCGMLWLAVRRGNVVQPVWVRRKLAAPEIHTNE